MTETFSRPAERDERTPESDERLLERWIVRQGLLEECAGRLELSGFSLHLRELIRGVRVGGIQREFGFERLSRFDLRLRPSLRSMRHPSIVASSTRPMRKWIPGRRGAAVSTCRYSRIAAS